MSKVIDWTGEKQVIEEENQIARIYECQLTFGIMCTNRIRKQKKNIRTLKSDHSVLIKFNINISHSINDNKLYGVDIKDIKGQFLLQWQRTKQSSIKYIIGSGLLHFYWPHFKTVYIKPTPEKSLHLEYTFIYLIKNWHKNWSPVSGWHYTLPLTIESVLHAFHKCCKFIHASDFCVNPTGYIFSHFCLEGMYIYREKSTYKLPWKGNRDLIQKAVYFWLKKNLISCEGLQCKAPVSSRDYTLEMPKCC